MTKYTTEKLTEEQSDILTNLDHMRHYLLESESDDYPVGLFKAFLDLQRTVEYNIFGDIKYDVRAVFDQTDSNGENN